MTHKTDLTTETSTQTAETAPTSKPTKATKLTKKARLIEQLGRKHGADIASLGKMFGWQPHSARAAISGLRKAGYEITYTRQCEGKTTRYRITGSPDARPAQ